MTKRILIVDDSRVTRLLHGYILRGAGYETHEAANGFEALEALARAPCDLALVDINMPRMDGFTLIRDLRARPEWRALPVIVVSTQQEARDLREGYSAGAMAYLFKPVEPEALRRAVAGLLAASACPELPTDPAPAGP